MVVPTPPRNPDTPKMRKKDPRSLQILLIVCILFLIAQHFKQNNINLENESISSKATTKGDDIVVAKSRPFPMPIKGKKYHIFQPIYDMNASHFSEPILSPPKTILNNFEDRVSWVNTMIQNPPKESNSEYAKIMYLEMMRMFVSGLVFDNAEGSVSPTTRKTKKFRLNLPYRKGNREQGKDWTYLGDTMTGTKRLNNVRDLLIDVIGNNIEGDYIETGVWRGGSSVFARAVISMLGEEGERISYVCDSFAGLPPGDKKLHKRDINWDNTAYLEVSSEIVANNFYKYGLLDSNVVFAKGFFNETMPPLSERINKISIMRLDVSSYLAKIRYWFWMYLLC